MCSVLPFVLKEREKNGHVFIYFKKKHGEYNPKNDIDYIQGMGKNKEKWIGKGAMPL